MAGHAGRVRLAARVVAFCCVGIWLGVIALVGAEAPGPRPAAAAGQNAAAVVVDDGSGPRSFCVLFSGESISGLEALQATNLGVTTRAFGAKGAAICGVGGTGCDGGTDCLTCKAPNYWGYSRAAAGAAGFTYSMAGSGTTAVTNGAVEGWLWGTGGSPAFRSFAEICPNLGGGGGSGSGGSGAPPAGGSPGAGSSGGGTNAGGGGGSAGAAGPGAAGSGSGSGGGSGTPAGAGAPVTSIDPVTGEVVTVIPVGDPAASSAAGTDPAATSTVTGTGTVVDADTASATLAAGEDTGDETSGGGDGWAGWIVFAVIVGAIATAGVVLRLRRGPA